MKAKTLFSQEIENLFPEPRKKMDRYAYHSNPLVAGWEKTLRHNGFKIVSRTIAYADSIWFRLSYPLPINVRREYEFDFIFPKPTYFNKKWVMEDVPAWLLEYAKEHLPNDVKFIFAFCKAFPKGEIKTFVHYIKNKRDSFALCIQYPNGEFFHFNRIQYPIANEPTMVKWGGQTDTIMV